jgi:hypothetical protein
MNLAEAIAQIDVAEDLFELLGVAFDPAVLAVHRIAILKNFGHAATAIEQRRPLLSEDERFLLYEEALQHVHDLHAEGGGDAQSFLRFPRPDLVAVDRLRRKVGKVNPT